MMEMNEIIAVLQKNGVVGAGGAGFPTYAKLDTRANTIILNCAECEPLLKLHRQLLEKFAEEIMQTFDMVATAVGASEVIIGIKKSYTKTIEALNNGISKYPTMRLGLLQESYPMGDEVVLIYEVTGKVVKPGGLPIESGVAVFNVETIYNLYKALNGTPVIDKLISVVAEVENPVTVRVPIGVTVEEVVALAGGTTTKNPVYFMGGPMMGRIVSGSELITKTSNAILVLPENHLILQKFKSAPSVSLKRAAASCCQCNMCTDLCPRHALGHPIEPNKFMRSAALKNAQDTVTFLNTMYCSSCGLCEMYSCMQGLSPRSLMAVYKGGLRANGIKPTKIEPGKVDRAREYRKVPEERLMSRLDLTKYDKEAPIDNETKTFNKVQIKLSQHIGAPSTLAVKLGDKVEKGQIIGTCGKGLSVNTHASISGVVIGADDKSVTIQKN